MVSTIPFDSTADFSVKLVYIRVHQEAKKIIQTGQHPATQNAAYMLIKI